jgi:hypothetical protein
MTRISQKIDARNRGFRRLLTLPVKNLGSVVFRQPVNLLGNLKILVWETPKCSKIRVRCQR